MKNIFNHTAWIRIGIAACLCCLIFTPITNAIDNKYDESFYSGNDILFYNPEDNSCTQSTLSSSAANLTGNTNRERIWNWLKSQGLSNEQAAGVMGNLQKESGFNPTRHDGVWMWGGWGLAQWTNYPDGSASGRRTAIATSLGGQGLSKYYDAQYSAAATDGSGRNPGVPEDINIKLLDFELNYMMQESQGRPVSKAVASQGYGIANAKEWDTLKQQKTIEDATVFWHNNFEVSNDSAATVMAVRGGFAQSAFNDFSGSSTQASSTSSSSSPTATACPASTTDSLNFNGGNFAETVKAYAWPDYHHAPYTQKMPAYAAAIEKAKSSGRYVGNDGVDCGGFVTTLMIDSGFDPNYNYGSKLAAGADDTTKQQEWLDANWDNLGSGKSIDPANLKPGDVAMIPHKHTFVYVGHIDGFNSVIASASNGQRSPMAGTDSLTASDVIWYRKKG